MTTTMTDLQTGRSYVFNEALPGRDAYEEALAQGFVGSRADWLAQLRGFAFDPINPDWAVDRTYPANAAVRHLAKLWVAAAPSIGTEPGTNPAIWTLLLDGAAAQAQADAVSAAADSASTANTAATNAEARRAAAGAILAQTIAASQALSPIDALHPVALPVPAGWWDTRDRLLSGTAERAIICNWQPTSLLPGALWRGTLASSVFDAVTAAAPALPGGSVARVEDQSGNAIHLTQATTGLRPIAGVRPAGGVRNLITQSENFSVWVKASTTVATGTGPGPVTGSMADTLSFTSGVNSYVARYAAISGAGTPKTFSVWLRGTAGQTLRIYTESTGGTYHSAQTSITLTGSWQRETVTIPVTTGNASIASAINAQATDTAASVEVWGAQFEEGATATAYQRVGASAFDVTEAGVASVPYLRPDLVDDKLVSAPITAGLKRTLKPVFKGVFTKQVRFGTYWNLQLSGNFGRPVANST